MGDAAGGGRRRKSGGGTRVPSAGELQADARGSERIRPGQRRLIFATAKTVGLRDEQLYDLVEGACDDRTRALPQLTIGEARRVIGVLKRLERNAAAIAREGAAAPGTPSRSSLAAIRHAARWAAPRSA